MHGNVREWCQDWHGRYAAGAQADPAGPGSGEHCVLRGGSWISSAGACQSAGRGKDTPETQILNIGLRVARSLPSPFSP
jgi:formylglycine-generating enzyme required for sulfatase activity